MRRVVLRADRDADGVRFLEVRLEPDGRLVIEGQDLGDGVERVIGPGIREIEWWWVVAAADVPAAMRALGGGAGEAPLRVIERWFAAARGRDPGSAIREAGVPIGFDSRMGD